MKYLNLVFLIFIFLSGYPSGTAQSPAPRVDVKNTVITMKQDISRGWGGGINSSYTVTLDGRGTFVYDGMDEGRAVSRLEPPVKVVRRTRINRKQFQDLVNEFYKIDFFSLDDSYVARMNDDGTSTYINDGGLADVVTSISVNGVIKSVKNVFFAPEKLIALQRKIYILSKIDRFVKIPPYWMKFYPNERFPLHDSNKLPEEKPFVVEYRKIARNAPPERKANLIELDKKWGFVTPCVTRKTKIEKLLGKPIDEKSNYDLFAYNLKDEKIRIYYSGDRTNKDFCGGAEPAGTVIQYSVVPIKDLRLTDLEVDLSQFIKSERYGGVVATYNNRKGLIVETEIVEFKNGTRPEMVTNIQFNRRIKK